MKKVLVAVALVMGLGSSVAFAQEVINTTSVEMQAQVPQDEFTKIDVKELPEAVAQAVAKNYEGATIKEAYVAEKEGGTNRKPGKKIVEATAYVCGLGFYEFSLNGKKVGNSEFAPLK